MKFDGFPGEKEILSLKLANGVGWLTTHHLIIQKETHNLRLNFGTSQLAILRQQLKQLIKGEASV
jgi:hypothetical protein